MIEVIVMQMRSVALIMMTIALLPMIRGSLVPNINNFSLGRVMIMSLERVLAAKTRILSHCCEGSSLQNNKLFLR